METQTLGRGPPHLPTLSLVQISTFIRDDLSALKYLYVVHESADP